MNSSPRVTSTIALDPNELSALDQRFNQTSTQEILQWAWDRYGERAAIGTSFQGAGLVMIHLARQHSIPLPVFTLDTGLLFPETLELKKRLEDFFQITIHSVEPEISLDAQEDAQGPELWKRNPDLCCTIRKVLPLQTQLSQLDCWITGLRRQQGQTRVGIGIIEVYVFDEASGRDIVKLNPMANWTRDQVWDYLKTHKIPYNPLHDQGYHSIGCHPCTSKTTEAGGERGGRWTGFNKVECGIHTFLSKKVDFQI